MSWEADFQICCRYYSRGRTRAGIFHFRQMGAELFNFSWAEPGESDASSPRKPGFWPFSPICNPPNPLGPAPIHSTGLETCRGRPGTWNFQNTSPVRGVIHPRCGLTESGKFDFWGFSQFRTTQTHFGWLQPLFPTSLTSGISESLEFTNLVHNGPCYVIFSRQTGAT